MCAPDAPAPPNYAAAADATAAGSAQAAIASNAMAHPNVNTPLGSQTWDQTGTYQVPSIGGNRGYEVPTYDQNINLSPDQQALFDKQNQLGTGLLDLGQGSLDQTAASLGPPQDFSSVQDIADQSYALQTDRLDPQWNEATRMQENKLANQGLVAGGEAYDNAMRTFDEGRNDAYNQARLSSISTMPQTFQLGAAERMQPLTELNAIRSGGQPQMPQFQPVQYQGTQGPNQLAAAGMQGNFAQQNYGNEMGGYNNMMSGLFGIGAAGAGRKW